MYKLPYFQTNSVEEMHNLIKENPFAIVTGNGKDYPVATQLPLHLTTVNDKIIFTGHMMKNTDHHKAFVEDPNVLVVFTGPHCYVSASWYTKPASASTWNYMTVHAQGKISFTDEARTREIVEELTDRYENEESAAAFKNLDTEYVDRLVKAIVGFTIEVQSMDNVFKLSQNHDLATRKSIIDHLLNREDEDSKIIADEMAKRI